MSLAARGVFSGVSEMQSTLVHEPLPWLVGGGATGLSSKFSFPDPYLCSYFQDKYVQYFTIVYEVQSLFTASFPAS